MDKFTNILNKVSGPVVRFVNSNKEMQAIKQGMVGLLPLTLFGSIILILTNFPYMDKALPDVHAFLNSFFGKGITASIGIVGIALLFSIAFYYSRQLDVNPIYGVITAFSSWIMLAATSAVQTVTVDGKEVAEATVSNIITLDNFGSFGMISSIFIALLSVRIYSVIKNRNITIKVPESVPTEVAGAFTALLPYFFTITVMNVVYYLFSITSFETFNAFIYKLVSLPLLALSDNPITIIIIIIIQQILWFFGIHGTMVVASVFSPIWLSATVSNIDAFKAGEEIPYLISQSSIDVYTTAGAAGIMAFIIALHLVAKSKQSIFIKKAGFGPAIFNIQEPVTFGMPLVYNPIYFIPFVMIPALQMGLAYFLMQIGFAPIPVVQVPWTVPLFISGLLTTNFNIMGSVTQLILLVMAILIWIPFIKVAEAKALENQEEVENA